MPIRLITSTILGVFLLAATALFGNEEGILHWNLDKTVDADISSWPIKKVLGRLTAISGWQVYMEPGLDRSVSVKFKNQPRGEALKRLLNGVNYALIPQGTGPSRLYIYENDMSAATSLVAADRPKNWLANELILSLSPDSKTDIDKLAAELGAKITGRSDDLKSYRLEFDDAEAAQTAREKIASRDDVAATDNFEINRPQTASASSLNPSSMFPIDPTPVTPGDQVIVALLDTAMQPLDGKLQGYVLPAINVTGETPVFDGKPTHGTSMANNLLTGARDGDKGGMMSKIRLLNVDIYGNNASTTTYEMARGLYEAINAGAHVINISSGGEGYNPIIHSLVQAAYDKGIPVIAAAGNDGTNIPTLPAADPYAIAVTAGDRNGTLAPYANYGDFVDLIGPGTLPIRFNGQFYLSSGTSTATAYTSGVAAALAAQGYTRQQILDHLSQGNTPAPR